MDDGMEIYRRLQDLAKRALARGETAAQWRKTADEQETEGFGVTADWNRVMAAIMERIERESHQ